MSITYIASDTMPFVKDAKVVYDFTMLGPRRKKDFVKALRSGIILGNTPQGKIVTDIRGAFDLGRIQATSWGLNWDRLHGDDFDLVFTCYTAKRMAAQVHVHETTVIEERRPKGWLSGRDMFPVVLADKTLSTNPQYDAFVAGVLDGTITTFAVNLKRNNKPNRKSKSVKASNNLTTD